MKINNNHTTYKPTNRPSFGSVAICRGAVVRHLKDGTKRFTPVEMHLLKAEDIEDIKKIKNKWTIFTRFGDYMIEVFLAHANNPIPYAKKQIGVNFLALKPTKTTHTGSKEPLCLAIVTRFYDSIKKKRCLKINYLQTAGRYLYRKEDRKVSGCGEMMMYGIAKLAKSTKCNELRFESTTSALDFYKKLFNESPNGVTGLRYILKKDHIDRLAENIAKKYELPQKTTISKNALKEISENSYLAYCD